MPVGSRVHQTVDAGDHDVVIGEVLATEARDGSPLVYFHQAIRLLQN